MPPPIRVEIVPYSVAWAELAWQEIEQLTHALKPLFCEIHHIGSTAVPGLAAKPVIDLMPVFAEVALVDQNLSVLERLGYCCWGELGISGRRYFTKDLETGERVVQLHCFQLGSSHIERHSAFRDYLTAHPAVALAYEQEKLRCAELFPNNSHSYSGCKADWIIGAEGDALRWYRTAQSSSVRTQ